MKNLIVGFLLQGFTFCISAQTTIVLKADRDVSLGYHDNYDSDNRNYGYAVQNAAYYIPGHIGGINANRAIFSFDLSKIPQGAIIKQATLNLYAFRNYPVESMVANGHFGENASYLRRVTSPWDEYRVTWNSKPQSTTTNQVILHKSNHANEDYIDIDVTALVIDMINKPLESHGFMLGLLQEKDYANLSFYSKEGYDVSKYPTLKIVYQHEETAALSINCPPSLRLETDCNGTPDIHAAYKSWKAGFAVIGGYNTVDNLDEKPSLPENIACKGAELSFTLRAKGYYETDALTCTSTFVVDAIPDVTITVPAPVEVETSCNASEDIRAEYEAWKSGFLVNGGCNTVDNLTEIPPLPENVVCLGTQLSFTLTAKGDCEIMAEKSTSTFTVIPRQEPFEFIMYPNPGRNILKIEFNSLDKKDIILYNIEGKLIFSITTEELIHEIVVRDLAPGAYFLQCSNGQKTITRKYIKMIRERESLSY